MKKYSILLALVLIISSCSADFLNVVSTEAVTEETAFATTDNALGTLNGLHRLMYTRGSSQGQCGYETNLINNDMMGEDMVFLFENSYFLPAYQLRYHRTGNNSNMLYAYQAHYTILANVNKMLDRIDGASGLQSERDHIRAQALVYRAYMHFSLVQYWGSRYVRGQSNSQPGIPLMLEDTSDPQPRSSVEEVYKSVNDDLDLAISLFAENPNQYKELRSNKIHINIDVAKGIKARVALTQGNWEDAAKYAAEVRANYSLSATTYTERPRFTDQSNSEWIWGTRALSDQVGNWSTYACYIADVNSATNRAGPKGIWVGLYNLISETDVRKGIFAATDEIAKEEFSYAANGNTSKMLANKYLVANKTQINADCPYMRLPEMILIQAEALARMGGRDAEAAQVLYELAHFRDPGYELSTKTGQDLVEEIWLQRRIELWGEGFRFLDLKRNDLPLNRNTPDGVENNHNGTWASEFYVPAGDPQWQYLFPDREMRENPYLEGNQNP